MSLVSIGKDLLEAKQRTNGFQVYVGNTTSWWVLSYFKITSLRVYLGFSNKTRRKGYPGLERQKISVTLEADHEKYRKKTEIVDEINSY